MIDLRNTLVICFSLSYHIDNVSVTVPTPVHLTSKPFVASRILTLQHELGVLFAVNSKVTHHHMTDVTQLSSKEAAPPCSTSLGVLKKVILVHRILCAKILAS